VVVLWQVVLARSASVGTTRPEAIVLASSVWLSYSADRWIEGWRLAPDRVRTHRHRFHQDWRWPMLGVWVAVLCVDVFEAAHGLPRREFWAGALLLVPVAAYLFLHQLVHRHSRWRPPKEACVALLLGVGAALFAAANPVADVRGMAAPFALFTLLCFSNCALISVWEDEVDRSHGGTSLALQFTRAGALLRALPWAVSGAAAAIWLGAVPHAGPAAACAAASGALLGLLGLAEPRIGRVPARVLADVALLTPAAWLAVFGSQ